MSQETLVLKLAKPAQEELTRRLGGGAFENRSAPHARFQVRGEGVVATLYNSGKLVVQGADAVGFVARYLDGLAELDAPAAGATSESADAAEIALAPGQALIGSDEAGKGDYFGPLVVAAVRADPDQAAELQRAGVADSKTLSDERALRLGAALRARYAHAIEVLEPAAYNREYGAAGNLNAILARMHASAIKSLHRPGDAALVDRFAKESVMEQALSGLKLELHQRTRAERHPVVAAASIIARATFLEHLRALSEEHAVDLHKGAGPPTDASGKEFVALHGGEKLDRVAKLHFKNTRKIRG